MKCRTNRARRLRRNRREIARLAQRAAQAIHREACKASHVSSDYYEVRFVKLKIRTTGSRREVAPNTKVRVVPNAKYREMMKQLLVMCGNLTVTIPREVVEGWRKEEAS